MRVAFRGVSSSGAKWKPSSSKELPQELLPEELPPKKLPPKELQHPFSTLQEPSQLGLPYMELPPSKKLHKKLLPKELLKKMTKEPEELPPKELPKELLPEGSSLDGPNALPNLLAHFPPCPWPYLDSLDFSPVLQVDSFLACCCSRLRPSFDGTDISIALPINSLMACCRPCPGPSLNGPAFLIALLVDSFLGCCCPRPWPSLNGPGFTVALMAGWSTPSCPATALVPGPPSPVPTGKWGLGTCRPSSLTSM